MFSHPPIALYLGVACSACVWLAILIRAEQLMSSLGVEHRPSDGARFGERVLRRLPLPRGVRPG